MRSHAPELVVGPAAAEGRGGASVLPARLAARRPAAPRRAPCRRLRRRAAPTRRRRSLTPDPAVGNAVQRRATRHGEAWSPVRSCSQRASSSSTSSRRACTVAARSACSGGQLARRRPRGRPAGPVTGSVRNPPSPVGVDPSRSCVEVARPAVGRQRHHLVLVAGAQEPQVLGERPRRAGRASAAGPGRRTDLQRPSLVAAGEVGAALPATVEHQHAVRVRRGRGQRRPTRHARRGGARTGPARVEARQRGGQELRGLLGVRRCAGGPTGRPAPAPRPVGPVRGRTSRPTASRSAGVSPAWAGTSDRQLRQLPGRERHRPLAVLAPAEALLLGGGNDLAVHHQGGGRVVEQGVDAENTHEPHLPSRRRFNTGSPEKCPVPRRERGVHRVCPDTTAGKHCS